MFKLKYLLYQSLLFYSGACKDPDSKYTIQLYMQAQWLNHTNSYEDPFCVCVTVLTVFLAPHLYASYLEKFLLQYNST